MSRSALRRPEVVILLVLVLGGVTAVLWTQRTQRTKETPAGREAGPAMGSGLKITRVTRELEGEHVRLRVDFAVRHERSAPVAPHPPDVRLLDGAGRELSEFFQAGDFPPDLPSSRDAAAWAEYWLTPAEADGTLTLEVLGAREKVPRE